MILLPRERPERREEGIPFGADLDEAQIEWARLEQTKAPKVVRFTKELFDRHEREFIPTKMPRTQADNRSELKHLRRAFDNTPIEAITPHVVAQYRDARTAKVRGNREIALLPHVFTMAREWGYTDRENPCARVRRNKEKARDYYAASDVWAALYARACQELRDAMDLAYLTGQRPADMLKVCTGDLEGEFLLVAQGKTTKKLRIRFEENGQRTGLGAFVDDLLERRKLAGITSSRLITNANGVRLSYAMLRNRWQEARAAAMQKAIEAGDAPLAQRIEQFRFSDIRPKAASEIDDLTDASKLLGHSKEQITNTVYRRVGEVVSPTR